MKLHLGCGNIKLKGFINIDSRATEATDIVCDVKNLSIFQDESACFIYSSHCLEHFSYRIVEEVLVEWYRVLKKGGEFILRVPNFDILVNVYIYGATPSKPEGLILKKNRIVRIINYIFCGACSDSIFKRIKLITIYFLRLKFKIFRKKRQLNINLLGDLLGGQTYEENFHKAIFNEKLLKQILFKVGFIKVNRIDFDYFPVDDSSKHYATIGFSCIK